MVYRERRRLKKILSRAEGKYLADIDIEYIKRSIKEATAKINKVITTARNNSIESRLTQVNSSSSKFKIIKSLMTPKSPGSRELLLKGADNDKMLVTNTGNKLKTLQEFYNKLYEAIEPVND